ncbi:hypothetical protein [Catellatospora sichuanensis]|uniref:hypothetical protein n=1 Tax=Catellatospora sichuanensis TaxID=1969805 RepID=UPI0011829315|nr:hypothetical protein [Catellatospora sichuanensis]
MPAPRINPARRASAEIAATDSYQPGDRVWVYRERKWQAGIISDIATDKAVIICGGDSGVVEETMTAPRLMVRDDVYLYIDTVTYV